MNLLKRLKDLKLEREKVCWRITRKCNLSCRFCLAGSRNATYKDMPLIKVIQVLNKLRLIGTKSISFTGGEPLLREDFDVILKESFNRNMSNTLTTNGTLITPYWIDVIKKYVSEVKVSLDGTGEIHNKLRNSETFDITFEAIHRLLENDVCVEINHVLTSYGIDCIEDFCKLFRNLAVSKINFIVPIKRENLAYNMDLSISKRQLKDVKSNISNIGKRYDMDLVIRKYFGDFYKRPLLETDGTILKCMSSSEDDTPIGSIFDVGKRQFISSILVEDPVKTEAVVKKEMMGYAHTVWI